jgi:hypothetical protein
MRKLLNLFRKKKTGPTPRPRPTPQKDQADSPKNGTLILGVALSVLMMFVLGAFARTLLRDFSFSLGRTTPGAATSSKTLALHAAASCLALEKREPSDSLQVTFYSKLTAGDDELPILSDPEPIEPDKPGPPEQPAAGSSTTCPAAVSNQAAPQPKAVSSVSEGQVSVRRSAGANDSLNRRGNKKLAVQVGAFSQPQIAEETALKLKARGYDVQLKPTAREGAGVVYRLYLAGFQSEKKMDEVVRQLRAKEGVSAFPISLAN